MADVTPAADSYFLSYSRSDETFALRLAKDLRAQGVHMWVDQFDIRPSEHWDRAIERAVRDCRGIVVVLSPRSVASDNVADEISYAIDSGKSVLPVMIERCTLPLRITRMQVVDATGNYAKALSQCVAELTRAKDAHAPAAGVPDEPRTRPHPETLSAAKQRLAPIVGPIAGILVDKAASRASSTSELYSLLAQHIEKEADRQQFLAAAGERAAPSASEPTKKALDVPAADLDRIAGALTHYLGPIAKIVTRRESRASQSVEELRQRLAALIPADQDRAEFLRRVGAG
jgi:hypothetical protein